MIHTQCKSFVKLHHIFDRSSIVITVCVYPLTIRHFVPEDCFNVVQIRMVCEKIHIQPKITVLFLHSLLHAVILVQFHEVCRVTFILLTTVLHLNSHFLTGLSAIEQIYWIEIIFSRSDVLNSILSG